MALTPNRSLQSTAHRIIRAAESRGEVDPTSDSIFGLEHRAAQWSQQSGLYCIWTPTPFNPIPASACDDIRSGAGQCCRVGPESLCGCGHALSAHALDEVHAKLDRLKGRDPGYIKPPPCKQCRCKQYFYVPSYPEECGQWWVKRRRDFNLNDWRKRVRASPHDYACIGCNLKVSDHETVFETRAQRIGRNTEAKVDDSYVPLNDYRQPPREAGVIQGQKF